MSHRVDCSLTLVRSLMRSIFSTKKFLGNPTSPSSGMQQPFLHNGHSSLSPGRLSLLQPWMHFRQKVWIHGRTRGSLKTSVQIQHSVTSSISSKWLPLWKMSIWYRPTERHGITIHDTVSRLEVPTLQTFNCNQGKLQLCILVHFHALHLCKSACLSSIHRWKFVRRSLSLHGVEISDALETASHDIPFVLCKP